MIENWFKLPLALRQRWWRETDYGRLAPSEELIAAIQEAKMTTEMNGNKPAEDPDPKPQDPKPAQQDPPSENKPVEEPDEGEAA